MRPRWQPAAWPASSLGAFSIPLAQFWQTRQDRTTTEVRSGPGAVPSRQGSSWDLVAAPEQAVQAEEGWAPFPLAACLVGR